jgi:hypothetical protein
MAWYGCLLTALSWLRLSGSLSQTDGQQREMASPTCNQASSSSLGSFVAGLALREGAEKGLGQVPMPARHPRTQACQVPQQQGGQAVGTRTHAIPMLFKVILLVSPSRGA